jgi:L-alanine-DL-glutamate epimerase-like enolase superfamily enzyme
LALTLPPATRAYARFPLIQEPALECDQSANPLREEVAPMPFKLKDGVLTAGDAPGLGVEVDRSALDRFLVR